MYPLLHSHKKWSFPLRISSVKKSSTTEIYLDKKKLWKYKATSLPGFINMPRATLREKCPYSEFFWSVFSHIRTEYGDLLHVRTCAYQGTRNFNFSENFACVLYEWSLISTNVNLGHSALIYLALVTVKPKHVKMKLNYNVDKNVYQTFIRCIFVTAQKMKFSIKDFFSKCYQIRRFLRIWSHLL